jgi:N-acetylmuramoyl-L-alanine amidase
LAAVGAVLLAGVVILTLAGGRLFGGGGDDPPRDAAVAAPEATGIPPLVLGSPVPAVNVVPPPAPSVATPKAAAFPGGRAPIVCLDPGHGGPDDGFNPILTDAAPDFTESVLVLQHAWDLEARLKLRGFDVVMTRRTDTAVNADLRDVNGDGKTARDDRPNPEADPGQSSYGNLDELQARINVCNEANADLLVSMHVNGYTTETPYGPEVWFTREREFGELSEEFAGRVYRSLKEQLIGIGYVLPEPERGVSPDSALSVDTEHAMLEHLVITGPAVEDKVDPSRMPGAVVETLFISNPVDAEILASPIGREAIVTGYENAIVEYFQEHPPRS